MSTLNIALFVLILSVMSDPAVAASPDAHQRTHAMQNVSANEQETFPFGHPGNANHVDRTVEVTATEYRFSPSAITVKSGETIRFQVTNKGKVDHEFVLGTRHEQAEHDKEMAAHPDMKMDDPNGISIPAGKTASLVWTFTRPMTIQYACHVPGHYAAGMYGTLVIRP